jgi:hypothetical protein
MANIYTKDQLSERGWLLYKTYAGEYTGVKFGVKTTGVLAKTLITVRRKATIIELKLKQNEQRFKRKRTTKNSQYWTRKKGQKVAIPKPK